MIIKVLFYFAMVAKNRAVLYLPCFKDFCDICSCKIVIIIVWAQIRHSMILSTGYARLTVRSLTGDNSIDTRMQQSYVIRRKLLILHSLV